MADTVVDSPHIPTADSSLRPKPPLSPQLRIEPASEWADKTLGALGSTEPISHHLAGTPGPELPGAYPYTPSAGEPGPSFEEVKETAKEYLHAAGQYVPSQEEIMKMAHNASEIMGGYIPNGVATYLGSPLLQQEAIISSPIDESETTPTADGCFVIINRGTRMPSTRNPGDHDAKQESSDISGHELPNENASTQTQPGSLASPEGRSDVNGVSTPFSYTAGAADRNDSKLQAADTHEDHRLDPSNGWLPEGRGPPNGIVNHGDADVLLGPGGEGTVTAPDAGVAAGPGPGPGLTGPTLLQHRENNATGRTPDREPMTMKRNGNAIVQSTKNRDGPSKKRLTTDRESRSGSGTNSPPPHYKGKKAEEVNRGRVEQGQIGQLTQDVPNTTARTHPLGQEGTQWKGVPLGESFQAALDRDEDRGLRVGETSTNAGSGVRTESAAKPDKPDTSSRLKPALEQMVSNTATTGHEKNSSGGTAGSSKFVEEPQNNTQPNAEPTNPPRPGSPMSDPVNPHVGRAVNGPKAAKLSEPGDVSQTSHTRGKSGLMNRFKAWSKRLSQDKKLG